MTITDRQAAIAELRQRQHGVGLKLQNDLIAGRNTAPTRAETAGLARRLEAEIAELHLDHEEVRRDRARMTGKIIEKMLADIAADVAKKMAPLAIPAPIRN